MNAQTQNMPTQSPAKAFQTYMLKYKSQLEAALPKHLTVDRMIRLSLTAFSQNPELQQCTSNSIFSSIIIASQLGLEPGVNGQGYLVPYKDKCTFIPGWKGLVDLAQRGGRSSVWTGAVYEGDDFDYMLGDAPYCKHRPCGEFDADKLTHVYAIGRVKDSEMPIIEVWPVKKVRAHFVKTVVKGLQPKHYSHKHFEAYARKVALLQVLKYMPQSVELSNAMDVSNAQESGKGVTIDGDFVNVDTTQYEQEQNVQISTPNDISDYQKQDQNNHEQEEAVEDYAPNFAQIKRGILTAKSPAHLDVMEEQVMDHADKEERKQLMNLIKAQSKKFEPTPTVEVQEVKKPEPIQEEEKPIEEEKKPTSTQVRKNMLEQINSFTNTQDLRAIIPFIQGDEILTDSHKTYVLNAVQQKIDELSKPKEAPVVNEVTSSNIKNILSAQIQDAKDIAELELVAKQINENKPKLTNSDHQETLVTYAQRKEILSQDDIFGSEHEQVTDTPVNRAIARIDKCQSQEDINAVWEEIENDPYLSRALTADDRRLLEDAANRRETEITA